MSCEHCKNHIPFAQDRPYTNGRNQTVSVTAGVIGENQINVQRVKKHNKTKSVEIEFLLSGNINFCPMCGTPLTEPEPLTVEQLLEMRRVKPDKGYDPVWVKTISDGKVSCVIANKLLRTDYRYKTPKTWADAHRVNLPLDDYGKTWVAYDRKPTDERSNSK